MGQSRHRLGGSVTFMKSPYTSAHLVNAYRNYSSMAYRRIERASKVVRTKSVSRDDSVAWLERMSDASSLKRFHMTSVQDSMARTSKGVAMGETVAAIPESLWITRGVVEATGSIGPYMKDMDTWVALSLFLIHETEVKETQWADVVAAWMECPPSTPILWKDDDLALLQGTQIEDSVRTYRSFFSETYQSVDEVFQTGVYTEEAFVRAACIVRAMGVGPLTGENLALVPGIDCLVHSRQGNTELGVQAGGLFGGEKSLVVKAVKAIGQGAEVSCDYAPGFSEGHVLLNHGRFDVDAPGTFAITLVLPETDRFYDDKIDILELQGLQASTEFILESGAPPPETMLAMLRLINLDNADAFLLESIFRNEVWGHVNLPVSEENEKAVYESMVSGCAAVLQTYPTKIDDDIALLNRMDGMSNEKAAVSLRLKEKEVLEATLRFFEDRMSLLESLEYYGDRRLKRLGLLDKEGKPTDWDSFFDDGIA